MPASRSCSSCGAALPGDVRWCLRCHQPVRELTPRAPLHDGPHAVGMPIATGGNAPHWSRWEKSATTFGPVGRILWTVAFVASVLVAGANGLIVYVLMSPVVGWVLLPAIWANGWVIPNEPDTPIPPDPPRAEVPTPPPTKAMVAWRIMVWAAASAALLAFVYGPLEAKAVVLSLGTLAGLYAFWRGFLSR